MKANKKLILDAKQFDAKLKTIKQNLMHQLKYVNANIACVIKNDIEMLFERYNCEFDVFENVEIK